MALNAENCADGPSNANNAMPIMDYYSEIGYQDLKSNNTENTNDFEARGEEEKTGEEVIDPDSKFRRPLLSHGDQYFSDSLFIL
jgi:hypothetical protein